MNRLESLKTIALKILNLELSLIEGVRMLLGASAELYIDDDQLNILVAIDSDTDHYPVGNVRGYWNQEALAELEKELEGYLEKVRPQVLAICKDILDK